jgi:hypothetical protein
MFVRLLSLWREKYVWGIFSQALFFQRQVAQQILTQFQEHPDAWTRVPEILEHSSNPQAKVSVEGKTSMFLALLNFPPVSLLSST